MTGPTKTSEPPRIRLVFQLERAELPRLYDELARFHKGVKRVGRLRTLAYEGLLVQQGVLKSLSRRPEFLKVLLLFRSLSDQRQRCACCGCHD